MDYKDTIFLPATDFPMRGNLAKKEPDILKYWDEIDVYKTRCETANKNKKFILHDGPPFANGLPHAGTALNRVLKDIILKMHWLKGFYAPFVPGWDCHGLPIEWKVEENLKSEGKNKNDISIIEFRKLCEEFAKYWIGKQKDGFKRLGTLGEWSHPYLTMDKESESIIVKLIGKFLLNGTIYQGEKPVYWSVAEQTALADAEIEYKDKVSTSIYVAFKVKSSDIPELLNSEIVIWTTTPWTLPANRAISFSGKAVYSIIKIDNGRQLVVAKDLLETFVAACNIEQYEIIKQIDGGALNATICEHPFIKLGYNFDVPLLDGEHVTLDAGTGFVHTAPGHGLDDFVICKKYNIPVPKTVNEAGVYYDSVPAFAGMHIFKVEDKILQELSNADKLITVSKIKHSYPHSWRSKTPLIFRTTPQWFISLDKTGLRQKALDEIKKVQWLPPQGYNRIRTFIENRGDWCISRQRVWGTPLPIFINKKTGEVLKDSDVIDRISDIFAKEGGSSWYTRDPQDFLGEKYNAADYIQSQDTVDVWFESSSSNVFVLQKRSYLNDVADLYLEGSDQHRGWFQHSLLVSCVANDRAPFKTVLTHGFVIDEQGRKMSKSLGNTIDLPELIAETGADIFRLCVASSDFTGDFKLGKNIIRQCQDTYKKLRNTIRYMLGALGDISKLEIIGYASLPPLEKHVLHKMYHLDKELMSCVENYDINRYFSLITLFCNNDLSAYLFDIRKDRLYCDSVDNPARKAYLSVIKIIFDFVMRWLSPILAFTTEEAWLSLYKNGSIHLQEYLKPVDSWDNPELAKKMDYLKSVKKVVTEALELARQNKVIGSSLQAKVSVIDLSEQLQISDRELLEELTIVSRLDILSDMDSSDAYHSADNNDIFVKVELADGHKCERCWKVSQDVDNNGLCARCRSVLKKC